MTDPTQIPTIENPPEAPSRKKPHFDELIDAMMAYIETKLVAFMRAALAYVSEAWGAMVSDRQRAETARSGAEASASAASSSRDQAAISEANAISAETAAQQAETAVRAMVEAEGITAFPATKADAEALTLADGDVVEVLQDETRYHHRVLYKQTAGTLEFLIDLDERRVAELASLLAYQVNHGREIFLLNQAFYEKHGHYPGVQQ